MSSIFAKDLPTSISASVSPGDKGKFLVLLDGKVIFEKENSGNFPHKGEIVELIKKEIE